MLEGNSRIVKEVDPGSRAERAGLKVGDRYTWEETESVKPVEGGGADPTRWRLHVMRGGEKLEIVLSLLEPLPLNSKSGVAPKAAE